MSKRLSDDEKRVFSDQITLLKKENERLTKCVEDLQTENERLMGLLTPYRLYSELNSAMGHAIRDFNKAIEKNRKHYEALIERAREDALLTGGDDETE